MQIAIFGLGYVGLTAAACLAKTGHKVIGIEVSEAKVAELKAGGCPISEPGLHELLREGIANERFDVMQSAGGIINECDMAIVCVGTPSGPDGSHNMTYISEVSRQIAAAISTNRPHPLTVVYRSTIRPGTIEGLVTPIFKAELNGRFSDAVELVYNPEFLREATAIADYFMPPKIVIGTANGEPSRNMDLLYEGIDAPIFYTPYRESEFTKFVDNTWHAVKVAFANEIGRTSVKLGISARKVHEIFVSDTKLNISPYYMRPGGAFGGSCLPKDVRALQYIAADVGAHTVLVDSLLRSNDSHKHFLLEHVTQGIAPGARVLMAGLSFKANSDDLRESANVDLARKLLEAGYRLSVYDPSLVPSKLIGANLGYAYTQLPALNQLFVTRDVAEEETWDLAVDSIGILDTLNIKADRKVSTNALP
ncbi:nucleotide sugar dehydrogenase [Sphingobium sp. CECT 9361]|uniref:nucleotide sugar dehydrogenase n=1 Tax=Sphingobium sp. CECT 9361 TaxID=2845384 RepID=UPI001E59F623|nr:nucleotide sugar dehydrogenase [Sphingobium sp. CECT 9361]CAH0349671.1 GDP-mannose 6-dehydrogenase [Sphingobium sp. CECT 9361]